MITTPILPPANLGIFGGGQLGRMFAVAARTMGYAVTVLDPDPNAPAAAFANRHLCAAFNDEYALSELAKCAAVTTEFENINAEAMYFLAQHSNVSPSGSCVAIAQNRIYEKAHIQKTGLKTVPYRAINTIEDIDGECTALLPGILKTATLGYDGKGQIRVNTLNDIQTAFSAHGNIACVLEKTVNLHSEISVIVCRLNSCNVQTFAPAENIHHNGILAYSIVPARLPHKLQEQARQTAIELADKLDYVGVLAVEMFVTADTQELIVNEIAPRPHNSGHYTLNACAADQFQQQVRIMCRLPPADTHLLSACCMVNILGDIWQENGNVPDWLILQQHSDVHLHLYGKKTARKGRKMGHFTVLANDADTAFSNAKMLHNHLYKSSTAAI